MPTQPLNLDSLSQNAKCWIIAEVAQAHDGSLGTAHAFIDVAAHCGVDAIKFQTHIAEAESHPSEPWRVRFSRQDASRYAYWKRMEFTPEQWQGLKDHATENGLAFLSSPFSIEAVDLLTKVGVAAWKIASGEIASFPMLETLAPTGLPVLFSTGMSPWGEIDRAVAWARTKQLPFAVLQCTTAYPCPPEKIGLNLLGEYQERYRCPVGLSDHSATIYPGLAAATLGASLIEVHLTLSRDMFGPDVSSSLTPQQLTQLVEGVRAIEKMRANPINKDTLADAMEPLRKLFNRSLVTKVDLPAGSSLRREDLTFKKPGTGVPASRLESVLGSTVKRDLRAGDLIFPEDLNV